MKEVRTVDAVGMVIAHDITRIIPGADGIKEAAFRKGHIVRQEDIEPLLKIGKKNLFVWADEPGLVHENDAAAFLYRLVAGEHMHPEGPVEGKINVVADADGLLRVDKGRLLAVNRSADAMVATRHDRVPVRKGDRLAGTRAIPLAVRQSALDEIAGAVGDAPILRILPFREKAYGIVNTGSELYDGLIEDGFSPVVRTKLAAYGAREIGREVVPDEPKMATEAILRLKEAGAQLIFVTGGMSVDPDDKTPLAIRDTGADIITYGAPVLPGAMFLVARLGDAMIAGLPGCVMHSRRTIFDLILPRLMADEAITKEDIDQMGAGGLCLECKVCIWPNCGFGV